MNETAAIGQLAAMIADLEGFVDRRGTELAAPAIDAARAAAADAVREARHEVARRDDLVAEFRRRLKMLARP